MGRLGLKYRFDRSHFDKQLDRDDFGRLTLWFETECFRGQGGFWVQWQDVVEFGESLSAFPIEADCPIVGQWGYEMQHGDDVIIRIAICPQNKTGDLLVSVIIADDHDQAQRLTGAFVTEYAALESFRRDIAQLMNSQTDEAVLYGK